MDKLNLLILGLLCSSTTARKEATVEPDAETATTNITARARGTEAPNVTKTRDAYFGYGSGYDNPLYGGHGYVGSSYGGVWNDWPSMAGMPNEHQSTLTQLANKLENLMEDHIEAMQRQYKLFLTIRELLTKDPQESPSGFLLFEGVGSYKFHTELITWDKARITCNSERAHLAIINSPTEADVLVKIFSMYRNDNRKEFIYLGFSASPKGDYVTVLGYKLKESGYTKWMDGKNSFGGRFGIDCGSMHKTGKLSEIHCTNDKVPFICEKLHF